MSMEDRSRFSDPMSPSSDPASRSSQASESAVADSLPATEPTAADTEDPALQLDALQGIQLRNAADGEQDPEKRQALLHEEWKRFLGSVVKAKVNGLDPVNHVYPGSRAASPEVAGSFITPMLAKRQGELALVKQRPEVRKSVELFDTYMKMFQEQNALPLASITPYSTASEIALAQMQMRKVEIPEEDRQRILFGINEAMRLGREIDPNYDIASDPDLQRVVRGISVDSGEGYFTEGEVFEDFGTAGGRVAYEGARAFDAGLAAAGNGLMDLGLQVMRAINPANEELLNAFRAEAWAEPYVDVNGNFVNRAPRAQGATDAAWLAWKLATGGTVDEVRERGVKLHDAETVMRAHERGEIEQYSTVIVAGLGSLASFMATGGGRLVGQGAKLIAKGKLGAALMLGAKDGTRLGRAAAFFRKGLGEGVGLGVYNATLYGRPEGYAQAFIHSIPMGLVFAAAGSLGRRTEKMLAERTKMPAVTRRVVGGAIEGLTISAGNALDMQAALWRFMRDPSGDTSNALMKEVVGNVVSFGIFKGLTGRTPVEARTAREAEVQRVEPPQERPRLLTETAQSLARQEAAAVARRERAGRVAEAAKATEAEIEARRKAGLEEEAKRRVVDYDQLTEPERRAVDADRRRGKPKSFNQRMKQVQELTDPLERTDFMELPEAVRQRITEAPDANQRKLIWFQHFTQGSGERRQKGQERRQDAPETVPARPLSPEGAKQVREALTALKGTDAARLADIIGTEPRNYTRGEREQIGNAIRRRLTMLQNEHLRHQLREGEPWHRGVKKDVFKGSTIKERLRKIRVLKEALRRVEQRPSVVKREQGPPPLQFEPRQAATLDRLLGEGTSQSLAGPHLEPQRRALGKRVYEKIQELRVIETRAQLAGRKETLNAARKQIRDLLGALRALEVAGEQNVIDEAGVRDEPGMPGVPSISLGQLIEAARSGEFNPFGEPVTRPAGNPTEAEIQKMSAFSGLEKIVSEKTEGMAERVIENVERRKAEEEQAKPEEPGWDLEMMTSEPAADPSSKEALISATRNTIRTAMIRWSADARGKLDRSEVSKDYDYLDKLSTPEKAFVLRLLASEMERVEKTRDTYESQSFEGFNPQDVAYRPDLPAADREMHAIQFLMQILMPTESLKTPGQGLVTGQFKRYHDLAIDTADKLDFEFSTLDLPGREQISEMAQSATDSYQPEKRRRLEEIAKALGIKEVYVPALGGKEWRWIHDSRVEPNAIRDAIFERLDQADVLRTGIPRGLSLEVKPEVLEENVERRKPEALEENVERREAEIDIEGVETFEEMAKRAEREGEIRPGTHDEMMLDRVKAQEAAEGAIEMLGLTSADVPAPRMGEPKSLRLVPQNVMLPVTTREVPTTRARDVMAALGGRPQDPVQIALREDVRIQGERTPAGLLGFFAPSEHSIRLLHSRATIEAVHETAHALDKVLQLRGAWRPKGSTEMPDDLYHELAVVASTYPNLWKAYELSKEVGKAIDSGLHPVTGDPLTEKQLDALHGMNQKLRNLVQSEGFAEFWARWRLEDPDLQKEVPLLHNFMLNGLMPSLPPGYMEQQNYMRQVLANYRDMGAAGRVRAGRIMATDKPTEVEREFRGSLASRAWRVFEEAMLDDLAGAKAAWARWRKASEMPLEGTGKEPLQIPATMDPLKLLQAFRMTAAQISDRMVDSGTTDIFGNRTGDPLAKFINKIPNDQQEVFGDYWTAVRVKAIEAFQRRKAYDAAYKAEMARLKKEGLEPDEAHPEADEAGKQAAEMAKIPELGFAMADVEFVIEQVRATKGIDIELFDEVVGDLAEFRLRVLDYGVQAGSLKESDRENVANAYDVYMPLFRVIESAGGERVEASRPGVGAPTRPKALKGLKGGSWEIADPIETLKAQVFDVVQKAQHHMVNQSFYLLNRVMNPRLLKHGQTAMGSFVTQAVRDAEPRTVFIDQIAKSIVKKVRGEGDADRLQEAKRIAQGLLDFFEGDVGAAIQFWVPQRTHVGVRPIMPFRPNVPESYMDEMGLSAAEKKLLNKEQGEVVWLELDPTVFNAMMTIDAPRPLLDMIPSGLRNLILLPSKGVRMGATVLKPAFTGHNIFRDTFSATIYKRGKPSYGLFRAISDGIGAAITQTQAIRAEKKIAKGEDPGELSEAVEEYQKFANTGGQGSSIYGTEFQRDFHRGARGFFRAFQKRIDQAARFLARPESWHRFVEYKDVKSRELGEGASAMDAHIEAALAAKEITTDFTRGGTIARALNSVVPYFAPNLAGKRKLYRTMLGAEGKEAQKAFFLRGMGSITAMSIAVYAWNMLNGDDDWREDLPEWQRRNYWNIKIPWTNEILKLSKPFEAGQMFGTLAESFLDAARLEHGDEMIANTLKAYLDEQASAVTNFYKWAAVLPFIEVMTNHSFFKDRELTPTWMRESRLLKDQKTRYTTGTGEAMAAAARFLGVDLNPIEADNLISGMTGGLGLSVARGLDELFSGDMLRTLGAVPQMMGSRSFVGSQHQGGAYEDSVYAWSGYLSKAAGSEALTPEHRAMRTRIEEAKRRIAQIKRTTTDEDEANRRIYELSKPIIDQLGSMNPPE